MSIFAKYGPFLFTDNENDMSEEEAQQEEERRQEQLCELMYMQQQYHGIIKEQRYALRGSKLCCQYGTNFARLDCIKDNGILKHTVPALTIINCITENIHSFGSCLCPEVYYAGRLPMTVAESDSVWVPAVKAFGNIFSHICVPLIGREDKWKQIDGDLLAEVNAHGYEPLLTDNAVLVCQYGGIISICEVPDVEEEPKQDIKYKKYVVISEKVRVRKCYTLNKLCPNNCPIERENGGCDIKGGKIILEVLSPGKRVNVIYEGKTPVIKKNDGYTWLKIEYEHEMGETAWVAEDFVLPDEPIITENFVKEVVVTKTYDNGNVETYSKSTYDKWYTSMGSGERTPGKYDVAIGPRIMNPRYPSNGKIWDSDFEIYSRDIDIVIRNKDDGSEQTINCYVSDFKAHTYFKYKDSRYDECYKETPDFSVEANVEGGIYQTGIRYPYAYEELDEWAENNVDGSIIEFIPSPRYLRKEKGIDVENYELIRVIAYFKDEEEFHEK